MCKNIFVLKSYIFSRHEKQLYDDTFNILVTFPIEILRQYNCIVANLPLKALKSHIMKAPKDSKVCFRLFGMPRGYLIACESKFTLTRDLHCTLGVTSGPFRTELIDKISKIIQKTEKAAWVVWVAYHPLGDLRIGTRRSSPVFRCSNLSGTYRFQDTKKI